MKNIQSLSDAELEDFIIRQTQKGGLKQNRQKEKITLPSQEMSQAGSFAQGALDSATLGFAPKIIAGIGAPILQYLRPDLYGDQSYQDVYQELRDTGRSEMEAAQQQNPVSYGLGGITGAATLPFPTKTIKGAAGLGALYGGLGALGASDKGEALQLGPENAMDALQGGALGAGLGALGQGIANKFFPKKTPNIEAQERVALGEKFNVPLTKGEALQSETELLKQESAKRGRSGASNATEMQAFDSQRTKEYKQAAQELVSKFTGGKEFTEKGANVGRAVDNLVNKALEEQIEYSNLYQGLKNNVGFIAAKDLKAFAAKALKDLENDAVFIEEAPQAYQKFKSLNKIINKSENINVKRLKLGDRV